VHARRLVLVLCVAAAALPRLSAQDGAASRPGTTTADLLTLVDVGVADDAILAHLEARGWPVDMTPETVAPAFRAAIGAPLRAAILDRLYAGTRRLDLAQRFKVYEIETPVPLGLLVPRAMQVEQTAQAPLVLELRPPREAPHFQATHFFAFVLELPETAAGATDAALKRGFFESLIGALRARIARRWTVEPPIETVLADAATKGSWPLILFQATDATTHRPGVLAATVVRRPERRDVVVLGLTTGPDVTPRALRPLLEDLATMAASVR